MTTDRKALIAAVAEELWRHDLAGMAEEYASTCVCSPSADDCQCQAPSAEALEAAWQEIRLMYPPDEERAEYLIGVVLRNAEALSSRYQIGRPCPDCGVEISAIGDCGCDDDFAREQRAASS